MRGRFRNSTRLNIGHRGRNILNTGSWSLAAKVAAAANLFVSVPFVLAALGPARFGAWATLVSLITFAGFLDFGFSNGAMNLIAGAKGRRAEAEVSAILRESSRALVQIAAALVVFVVAALAWVPWHRVLGLDAAASGEGRFTVGVVLFSIVAAIPLNLAHRAQLGLGRGDRSFRWQAIGQLAALAAVIVSAKFNGSLVALTAAAVATPLLASAANTYLLWRSLEPDIQPATLDHGARANIRNVIRREGLSFFGLQLAAALAFSADLPLISMLRGPVDAGAFAIVLRLFSTIPLALSLVWAPLWPIYRQALAEGNHAWVKHTFRRSLVAALTFSSMSAVVLVLGFNDIVLHWLGHPLAAPVLLLVGFGTWCVIEAAGTALATFLNAASMLRYQLATSCVFALTCLAGKAWVIAHGNIELVPWVTVTTYLFANVAPLIWYWRRLSRSAFTKAY